MPESVLTRRWKAPQFSIRALIVALTVVAVVFSVYATFFRRTLIVASHVRSIGGRDGWYGPTIAFIDLNNTRCNDEDVGIICGLGGLVSLELNHTDISDRGVERIARLTSLKVLTLDGTSVGDKGILSLRGLKFLKHLSVKGTHVTKAGVDALNEYLP